MVVSYPQRSWDDIEVEVVANRLWAGGVATALVAAGIGFVGVLLITEVLQVGVQTAGRSGALLDNAAIVIPIAAGLAALAATALLHLLLLTTPRPTTFFAALVMLATAVVVLQVFLAPGSLAAHLTTGCLYAAIGLGIIAMLCGVAATSVRPAAPGSRGDCGYDGRHDAGYSTAAPGPPDPTEGYDPRRRSR